MTLNFHKHDPNSEYGVHYGAISGAWPNQRRFVIERRANDWSIHVLRHMPGAGFVLYLGDHAPTLKAAKARCEDILHPRPIGESALTDA